MIPSIPSKTYHRASVWQLVLGIISFACLLFGILLLIVLALSAQSEGTVSRSDFQEIEKTIGLLAFFTLLIIPSIFFAIRRLSNKDVPQIWIGKNQLFIAACSLVSWVGLILIGNRAAEWNLSPFLMVLIDIMVSIIPVLFWLILAGYHLFVGSKQRAWGIFNFTEIATSMIIIVVEITLLIFAIVFAFGWISKQAEFLPYLSILQNQGALTEQNLQSLWSEITATNDITLIYGAVILGASLLVPLVEELLKPLAVWILAGRKITPSEGFFAGLLCGAAFGLFESTSVITLSTGSDWMIVVLGRVGTSLLHVVTAGISGWALAKSWQDGKYWRISLVYLGMIVLHGTWNFFAIMMGLNQIAFPMNSELMQLLVHNSYWVLAGLGLIMAMILIAFNRHLRRESTPPMLPPPFPELSDDGAQNP